MKYWVQINTDNIVIGKGRALTIPDNTACIEVTYEQYQLNWICGSLYKNGEFIEQPKEPIV